MATKNKSSKSKSGKSRKVLAPKKPSKPKNTKAETSTKSKAKSKKSPKTANESKKKPEGLEEQEGISRQEQEILRNQSLLSLETLFIWESPERMWSPKSRVWYLAYAALFSVLILASAKLGFWILIIGLVALLFLLYVQASVEPWITKHKITQQGVITRDTLFRWDQIMHFWFSSKDNFYLLYIDFKEEEKHPRIQLILDPEDEMLIFNLLIQDIPYANPKELGHNILSRIIYGKYTPITNFIQDLDQPPVFEGSASDS